MPDDWVHCLFVASIIGEQYESKHCWVNQLLDSPVRFLGGHHRILLHDLETTKKLGSFCWWAGFVAALHIDTDNLPPKIRSHMENVVRPIKIRASITLLRKIVAVIKAKVKLKQKAEASISTFLRKKFLKVHKKVGIDIQLDDETSKEAFILIYPKTLLRTTWDYVNQFPLKGYYVNGLPYNKLPMTEPRIIPHPNLGETSKIHPHGASVDRDVLRRLFSNE